MGALPCPEIESRMKQECQRLYANLQSRDRAYDRRTNNGLRQDK